MSSLKLEVARLRQKLYKEVREKLQLRKEVYDSKDIEELDCEAAFVSKAGFQRTNPQESSLETFSCKKCSIVLKSSKEMELHIKSHEVASLKYQCNKWEKKVCAAQ